VNESMKTAFLINGDENGKKNFALFQKNSVNE
jgi:hypothetical protein